MTKPSSFGNIMGMLKVSLLPMLLISCLLGQIFSSHVIVSLKKIFKISTEASDCFNYVGIHINVEPNLIKMGQGPYIDSFKPAFIEKSMMSNKDIELSTENKTVFREIVVQLNWISNTKQTIYFIYSM